MLGVLHAQAEKIVDQTHTTFQPFKEALQLELDHLVVKPTRRLTNLVKQASEKTLNGKGDKESLRDGLVKSNSEGRGLQRLKARWPNSDFMASLATFKIDRNSYSYSKKRTSSNKEDDEDGKPRKQVKFVSSSDLKTIFTYPSVQSYLEDGEVKKVDLWYSAAFCKETILRTLQQIQMAKMAKIPIEPHACRGLEGYTSVHRDNTERLIKEYRETLVQKSKQGRKKSAQPREQALKEYSQKATAPFKDMAHMMGYQDEIEARNIYQQDGINDMVQEIVTTTCVKIKLTSRLWECEDVVE